MKRRMVAALFAATLSSLSLGGTAAADSPACSGPIEVETFTVAPSVAKQVYRVGDEVRVSVFVQRFDHEDLGMPAEDVFVVVGAQVRKSVMGAGGYTDAEGIADIDLRMRKFVTPGSVDLTVRAYKRHVDLPCYQLDETGYAYHEDFFRVRR